MKEVEGKNWSEIRAAVEEAVGGGVKIGGSTLQVRYARMKANFVVFEKDDVCPSFLFFTCFTSTMGGLVLVLVLVAGLMDNRKRVCCRRKRKLRESSSWKSGRGSRKVLRIRVVPSIRLPRCRRSLRS